MSRNIIISIAVMALAACSAPPDKVRHYESYLPGKSPWVAPKQAPVNRVALIRSLAAKGVVFASEGQSTALFLKESDFFQPSTNRLLQKDQALQILGMVAQLIGSYETQAIAVSPLKGVNARPGRGNLNLARAQRLADFLQANGVGTRVLVAQPHNLRTPLVGAHFRGFMIRFRSMIQRGVVGSEGSI